MIVLYITSNNIIHIFSCCHLFYNRIFNLQFQLLIIVRIRICNNMKTDQIIMQLFSFRNQHDSPYRQCKQTANTNSLPKFFHKKTPSILKYLQYGRKLGKLYGFADKHVGEVGFEHIADNRSHLKFGHDAKNRRTGTGHLVSCRAVLMHQRLDVV